MSPLFGGRNKGEKTVLLIDIENGSVGGALVRLEEGKLPSLLGETRRHLPLFMSRDSQTLLGGIEDKLQEVLEHLSLVAARLRGSKKSAPLGTIDHISVSLSAPWGTPNLTTGRPTFLPGMRRYLKEALSPFTNAPVTFHTHASSVAGATALLYGEAPVLSLALHGEITELILMQEGRVMGYATLPQGYQSFMRTMKTHAGHSTPEAHSLFKLQANDPLQYEPLAATGEHFSQTALPAIEKLFSSGAPQNVLIVSHSPAGQWLARALPEQETFGELFPQGSSLRLLKPHTLQNYIQLLGAQHDISLLLDALFAARALRGIQ